jgi:hypothetical protein
MRRRRLIIALLIVAGLVAYIKHWRRQLPMTLESPPCQPCAEVYATATPEILPVTVADLLASPERATGRLVRLRAILHNDAGYKTLYEMNAPRKRLLTEFSDLKIYGACDGVKEGLHKLAGVESWHDGDAGVVVVGRMGNFDNLALSAGVRPGSSSCVWRVCHRDHPRSVPWRLTDLHPSPARSSLTPHPIMTGKFFPLDLRLAPYNAGVNLKGGNGRVQRAGVVSLCISFGSRAPT